jgi:uncharacterized membrane protein
MFERFWLVLKNFLLNHSQHAWLETVFIILVIISGVILIFLGVMFIIKINKYIRSSKKAIEKSKKASDKKILILLKKKKNITF